MQKDRLSKEIYQKLLTSERVLLIPHQKPDGDAMGAVTALATFLDNHGIYRHIWCLTPPPAGLMFLPHATEVSSDPTLWQTETFDTIVVVDSGDLVYNGSGPFIDALPYRPTIINIDHHATNQNYGNINLVVTSASSTNEILYSFFSINREPITPLMATSLMTGLITDTGTFTNAGTSRISLSVGGELIRRGADYKKIKQEIINDKTLPALRLWGEVLSRLTLHEPTKIAYTYVAQEDLIKFNVNEEEAEGIANLLNFLDEGRAIMVLKGRPDGSVKGSFRTTLANVNVSAWAQLFGGGGHVKAAGFAVELPLEQAIEHILSTITKYEENFT